MKSVQLLKGTEAGQDIYILASGKSLDYIPAQFFDNKILIGCNEVYEKQPCKYYIRKEKNGFAEAYEAVGAGKLIVSRHDCGNHNGKISNFHSCDYYIFDHLSNDTKVHLEELDTERIIVSWSTITSAMHIAYLMGAKNIILCGADCGTLNGESNYQGYINAVKDKDWYVKWLGQISPATEILAGELRKRGLGVMSLNPFVNYQLEGNVYEARR